MKTYMLFGLHGADLQEARVAVEAALGIRMTLHESSYLGEYFRFDDVGFEGSEHFILQKNFDDVEGEWAESAFPNYGILLYANETNRGPEIRDAMASVAQHLTTQDL